jgi:hypothetical protein
LASSWLNSSSMSMVRLLSVSLAALSALSSSSLATPPLPSLSRRLNSFSSSFAGPPAQPPPPALLRWSEV